MSDVVVEESASPSQSSSSSFSRKSAQVDEDATTVSATPTPELAAAASLSEVVVSTCAAAGSTSAEDAAFSPKKQSHNHHHHHHHHHHQQQQQQQQQQQEEKVGSSAQEFLRARERQYAENVENLHKQHGLQDASLRFPPNPGNKQGDDGAAAAAASILGQFHVKIAYSRLVPLREFVGWGESLPFDVPRAAEAGLRRLVASLNFYGSNYFVVIAAAYVLEVQHFAQWCFYVCAR